MTFTRNSFNLKQNLDIDGHACEKVRTFTHLSTLKIRKHYDNEEIKMKTAVGNHYCYAGFKDLTSSHYERYRHLGCKSIHFRGT
jgi:hypothetical protein